MAWRRGQRVGDEKEESERREEREATGRGGAGRGRGRGGGGRSRGRVEGRGRGRVTNKFGREGNQFASSTSTVFHALNHGNLARLNQVDSNVLRGYNPGRHREPDEESVASWASEMSFTASKHGLERANQVCCPISILLINLVQLPIKK